SRDIREFLPAADSDVDVQRIQLNDPSDPAGALGAQHGGAAAAERVQYEPVPATTVANQIGHEGDGFDGRVKLKLAATRGMQAVDAGVFQHVGAVAAIGAESEVIDVRRHAIFEHSDKFVL